MAQLTIALEEGFDDTHVVVRVNGVSQLDDPSISTRPQIGLARSLTVEVPDGPVTVDVELPELSLGQRIDLDVRNGPHLGLSISGGTLTHRVSEEPFRYA